MAPNNIRFYFSALFNKRLREALEHIKEPGVIDVNISVSISKHQENNAITTTPTTTTSPTTTTTTTTTTRRPTTIPTPEQLAAQVRFILLVVQFFLSQ